MQAVLAVIEEKMTEWIREGMTARLGIRIPPIGELELLAPSALRALQDAEAARQYHNRMLLTVGEGYGGRQNIMDTVEGYPPENFLRGSHATSPCRA